MGSRRKKEQVSESEELEIFCDLADQISKTKVWVKTCPTTRITIGITMENGNVSLKPNITDDEFSSFLIVWRKLFVNQEPGNFHRAWNLVAKKSSPEIRKEMKRSREENDRIIESDPVTVRHTDSNGDEWNIDYRSIFQAINGGVFHPGNTNERRFLKVIKNENHEWEPIAAFQFLSNALNLTLRAIRLGKYVRQEILAKERGTKGDADSSASQEK